VQAKRILFPFSHNKAGISSKRRGFRVYLSPALKIAALALLVFALARPQSSTSQTRRTAEGIDIMMVLDVSQSMVIEDYDPYSRLDIAKDTIKKFIMGRKDDRIGFLIFSGEAVILCPPTLDYNVLLNAVDMANTSDLKDGTAIGDGLATAVSLIKDSNAKSKVIILATDGDNNMGSVAPLTAGHIAAGYGIRVYTIALGREGMVPFPQIDYSTGVPRKVYQNVNSTINPELLEKIAEETHGKFFRPTDVDSLKNVYKEIDKLEKTKVETKERIHWNELYQDFLLLAILFLALDFILTRTFLRILPN
jgi:Ca-activated chloride channel family protein